MAYLDHQEAYEDLKERVLAGLKTHFPIKGSQQSLELEGLRVEEPESGPDDIRAQHKAKVNGETWAAPVYANLTLRNKAGEVVQKKTMRVAEIPLVTRRYSHIIDGQEYQVDNQWQLKHGVYTRRMDTGELESRFNTPRKEFKVLFDPETKLFHMERGKSKAIPMYPLMKAMGVDDDTLQSAWGKDVLTANADARGVAGALTRFYKADRKLDPASHADAEKYFQDTMAASEIDPGVTNITLGKPFKVVEGDTLVRATKRIMEIQAGKPEDDRDSLDFKRLRSVGDFAYDKLTDWAASRSIKAKMARKVNQATDIREVLKFGFLNEPIKRTFKDNSAARVSSQINPVEMVGSAQQTTITGPGGIQSEQALRKMIGAKLINPSHLGFLDPVRTPENEKTGIVLRLPMGVKKVGGDAKVPLYNIKTKQMELLSPTEFNKVNVVLPDQVKWEGDTPTPIKPNVAMSTVGNKMELGKFKDADYVIRHPSQLFSVTTNLIPFLNSTSGNRATYAGAQIEQAISLKHREAPLVQVGTGINDPDTNSFEGILGRQAGHVALKGGKVSRVTSEGVFIKGPDGKEHEVQLYNNFPLNDPKGVLHSNATVKAGDTVKAGQSVADTNFTKGGKLALGVNLNVAYIPFKGYNFEDGVVISRSAAQKLTSEHLHKETLMGSPDTVSDPRRFRSMHPGTFSREQYDNLDGQGVIKVGTRIQPGDPLALAMKPFKMKDRVGIAATRKSLAGRHIDTTLRWNSDYPGEVVAVHQKKDGSVAVHVRTEEPMQVGDKIAGRYGNKGIVTTILDDHLMPRTKSGNFVEVALNPLGVPGRMNVGQVFETAAAKIAKKTGKPYIVQNFAQADALTQVKADLKKHGLKDQEELIDPETGMSLGPALFGPQHMLKLVHQVDKKISVRSGMAPPESSGEPAEKYDLNLIPSGSGKTGGQSIGHNGLYSLLAHGAKANIREMQTWKSEGMDKETNPAKRWPSDHLKVWEAIQTGEPLPTPKPSFSFKKFTELMKGAGINIEKQGHTLKLLPFTDSQVIALSNGELKKPNEATFSKLDSNGELKPLVGGIFDPKVTGGHGGKGWSHIRLPEPVPNPVFEGPIRKLTGLKEKEYDALVTGHKALSRAGTLVDIDTPNSLAGGHAIKHLLDQIDVPKELASCEQQLKNTKLGASTQKVDKLVKRIKYLRTLDQAGMKPSDAYVLHNLPVLPPAMRPVSLLNGNPSWGDLNGLYTTLGQTVTEMRHPTLEKNLTESGRQALRADLYDGVSAIMGMNTLGNEKDKRGILHQISGVGSSPKFGFFQQTLMKRKQDLTMRSTIIPEPSLGLDEVGLPREKALTMMKAFVVKKLVDIGAAKHALEAQKLVQNKDRSAYRALDLVCEERPVAIKRDPALHLHSVQGFTPKIVSGSAIRIHPLTTSGYNADFDGDTMSVYVPISQEAVKEVRGMMPSNNLYNQASGSIVYKPTLESALGLYKISRITGETNKRFANSADAIKAVQAGKLSLTETAHIGSHGKTTAGRVLLASALPDAMQKQYLNADPKALIDSKGLESMFTSLAKNHKAEYGNTANRLKDLGNGATYGAIPIIHPDHTGVKAISVAEKHGQKRLYVPCPTHSLSLDDFTPDTKIRGKYVNQAEKQVANLTGKDKERRANDIWATAIEGMTKEHLGKLEAKPTNLALMVRAGVKPSENQYRQMVLAPGLLRDASGKVVPIPVVKSYAEGLDVAGYWTQMQGARSGTIQKVQEVSDPGYFSKQLMQNTMASAIVVDPDCGTERGLSMPVGAKDIHDRILAADFSSKGLLVPKGTTLTPEVVTKMRSVDKGASALVRSTLKCEHEKGVCQKCAGMSPEGDFYRIGTNLGVLAAQSLGERSVQLTLKQFHSGGTAGGRGITSDFRRVQELTLLPKNLADSATLASKSGKIDKIEQDATGVRVVIGGKAHFVGKDRLGNPLNKPMAGLSGDWLAPKVGMKVEAGQVLSDPSRTVVNPHDLYKATNSMERVQNFLTDELHGIYKNEGVRRQHVETVVRSMGMLTRVTDPGDSDAVLKGEFRNASKVRALNNALAKAGKRPIEHSPVLKNINTLPLETQEDWMAKMMHQNLRATVVESAAMGAVSDLHGLHPVPGIAYGAEFGLTKKDSLKPGLGHLKNVPDYAH